MKKDDILRALLEAWADQNGVEIVYKGSTKNEEQEIA